MEEDARLCAVPQCLPALLSDDAPHCWQLQEQVAQRTGL